MHAKTVLQRRQALRAARGAMPGLFALASSHGAGGGHGGFMHTRSRTQRMTLTHRESRMHPMRRKAEAQSASTVATAVKYDPNDELAAGRVRL